MMSKRYNELVKNPPKDKQVCDCVRNVNQNGVKKFLNYMALKIRYVSVEYSTMVELRLLAPEIWVQIPARTDILWNSN